MRVKHMKTKDLRFWAAGIVADNWRLRKRLPRITAFAAWLGLLDAR
jgi:hypothetical protein